MDTTEYFGVGLTYFSLKADSIFPWYSIVMYLDKQVSLYKLRPVLLIVAFARSERTSPKSSQIFKHDLIFAQFILFSVFFRVNPW